MPGPGAASGAGDLRARVTFAKPDSIPDGYGNVSTGWVDQFTVFANIAPRLGGETVEAERLAGRQPVVIRIRNTPDTRSVRTDWKATDVFTGTEYNVRAVVDPYQGTTEHGRFVDMIAEAGVAI